MGTTIAFRKIGHVSVRRCAATALSLFLLAALAAPALADRVVTKSGETYTGTIIEDSGGKVVLKMNSGTMTFSRDHIKSVNRGSGDSSSKKAPPPAPAPTPATPPAPTIVPGAPSVPTAQVVPVKIEPAGAADAFKAAKMAVVAGDWAKAAGLMEGLFLLDEQTFPIADRLTTAGALATCYLQIKDAQGAARAVARRAQLGQDPNEKRRLLAASEMLRTTNTVQIGGKELSRVDEVVEVAMQWKVGQCLAEAKDVIAKAQRLNEASQVDKTVALALKKLAEADVFVPGFSAAQRAAIFETVFQKIVETAKAIVDFLDKERPELTRTRMTSLVSRSAAQQWNDRAVVYLDKRQAAEFALKNLKAFCGKYEATNLYTSNGGTITDLLGQLDEYQYYPKGTRNPDYYDYYGYGYGYYERMKITLRTF